MVMSYGKTFMTVLTLLGMVVSLSWPAVVQAGGGGECCLALRVHGTVSGGMFTGRLTLTDLAVEDGQLLASGFLGGTVKVRGVTQETGGIGLSDTFTDVVVGLLQAGQPNVCDILILDFSPIHLGDLDIDLSPIFLTVHAHGFPPGQLLCELADLLDSSPLNLPEIQQLLAEINYVL
jgi:hypothetical protein